MIGERPEQFASCVNASITSGKDCSCYYEGLSITPPGSAPPPPGSGMPRYTLSAAEACQKGIIMDCSSIYEPLQCDSSAPEKRASVLIRFGYGDDRYGPASFRSLGVLTERGIWTHDHFAPEWQPTGDLRLPDDNIAEIQRSPYLEFEGADGVVRAFTEELDIIVASGIETSGSLLIVPRSIYVVPGSPISSLQDIGDPTSLSSLTLNQLRHIGRPVTAVFAPGSALPASWNDLCVGKGIALGIVSESIARPNRLKVALSEMMNLPRLMDTKVV